MIYFSLLVFALVPSLIWLLYFLRKDENPEPKKVLFFAFLGGGVATALSYFAQIEAMAFSTFFLSLTIPVLLIFALMEEFLKYVAFLLTAKRTDEVDEPVDFVIYMITIALGFVAVENGIYLFSLETVVEMAQLTFFRFLTATLLHALASGILGVFLYVAVKKSNKLFTVLGLLIATLIHGIYNIIIFALVDANYIGPMMIFIAIFLSFLFFCLSLAVKKITVDN
ncbi:MAG: PrsW family glutamic-type intramembrane protease [Patescibacteria group bacterium]|nr:PrsW family glutamic-type intramembrane protease [Patescibacteria group bacterium]